MGGADRERRARAGVPLPGLHDRHLRPPGPGRARAAGGHARGGGRGRGRTARTRRCRRTRDGRAGAPARAARRRRAAVRDRRRRRVDGAGARRTSSPSPRRTSSRSVPAFRRQDYVDNASRVYAGHVGIGPDPKLAARVRDADLLLVVGARLGESTTGGYTLVAAGRPRADARPRPRRRRGARPRVPAAARDRLRLAAVRGAARGARARRLVGLARRDRAGARRPPREHGAHARARRRADGRRDGGAARAAAGRRDPHERRRQLLRLGAPLLRVPPLPDAARADERRHGLRPARRRRRQAASTPSAWSSASPATATS